MHHKRFNPQKESATRTAIGASEAFNNVFEAATGCDAREKDG